MITKNDCLSILVRLGDSGIKNTDAYMRKLLVSREIPLEVLKFISENRGLEISNFYEMIRKSHNKNKSPLYTNIVREQTNPGEIVLTLNCLMTQILLYSKKLEQPETFFKEARAEEITRVLNEYFSTGTIENCDNLLKIIKSDLLVLAVVSTVDKLVLKTETSSAVAFELTVSVKLSTSVLKVPTSSLDALASSSPFKSSTALFKAYFSSDSEDV
jgi:hypothetical protein